MLDWRFIFRIMTATPKPPLVSEEAARGLKHTLSQQKDFLQMKTVIKRRTAMVILAIVLALFTTFTLVLAQGLPGVQVLYALKPSGQLSYYSYSGLPNPSNFRNDGRERAISNGWNMYSKVFSGGPGVLFALKPSGQLSYYSYSGLPDPNNFRNGGQERAISNGWNIYQNIFGGWSL
ncbi:MAG: hypothetical protein GDA38_00075 [Hormoscilla sp. SP12CHS1]|nr:hypothetical protein [Hormoscilla sp. SP12CHS1]